MKNILLKISYDGTDFCGWQKQNSVRTIQGEIERALEKIHKTPVQIFGSGRTDSGVHARMQMANFFSPNPSVNYPVALNSILPRDIRILNAEEKNENFNARFSATSRTYRYFIADGKIQNAFCARYSWKINPPLNLDFLNDAAQILKGEIDCKTFAASGDKSRSTFRYIYDAKFFRTKNFFLPEDNSENSCNEQLLVFEISANAFLWKMVRSIVGTLIFFAQKKRSPNDFKIALESHSRKNAGPTAPPNGLFLWDISFSGKRIADEVCQN